MSVPAKTEELHLDDPFEIPVDVTKIPVGIKAQMAFELRKAGAPYGLIADKLGYKNDHTCESAIRRVLSLKYKPDDVETVVDMELARLDALQLVAWRRAKDGDLSAIDRILKIMERRSQYLGLDRQNKASQGEVINNTAIFIGGSESEYIEHLRQVRDQVRQRALEA
jgi:hypothetical protein